ncbi:hypothetical protein [Novosphingobium sp.]|uniref:hypothetical protein n=1 Tax=Novosphingobium sp. TaxID=1874826 RepID=UPI00333EA535
MKLPIAVLGAIALFAGPAPATAQQPAADDALPNLVVPAQNLGDERKYFILHKPGVTAEAAEQDLAFCWRYLPRGVARSTPDFVPWRMGQDTRTAEQRTGNYGLVGDVIGAMIAGPIERSLRQSRVFRCMVPRGYHRYRTSEAVWRQINEGDPARAIRIQARLAAGAVPPTPEVTQ